MSNEIGDRTDGQGLSRRTTVKAIGAAGVGLTGSVVATGDAAAAGPTAVIEVDPFPPEEGEDVTFDASNSSGNLVSYEWHFRNNFFSDDFGSVYETGEVFVSSWANYPYSVQLVVTDDSGNTDSAVVDFYAKPEVTPIARIVAEPLTSDAERQTFIGRYSSAPRGTIESYDWYYRNDDLGGGYGKYAEGPSFTEQWADYQYTVKLVVTDSRGKTGSDTVTFHV